MEYFLWPSYLSLSWILYIAIHILQKAFLSLIQIQLFSKHLLSIFEVLNTRSILERTWPHIIYSSVGETQCGK